VASCAQVESLIQAYIDGELGASETAILEEHISECRLCAAAYKRQKSTAALLFETFAEHRLDHDLAPMVLAHLPEMDPNHLRASHDVTMRTKHQGERIFPIRFFAPIMALSILLVLGIMLALSWPPENSAEVRAVGMVTYQDGKILRSQDTSTQRNRVALKAIVRENERFETDENAALMITLAGPTLLKVDNNTRVKVTDEREIDVEIGQIWLNVCKDQRSFRVTTPSGDITVFGTVFNVEVTPDSTVVTVENGRVQVSNNVAFTQLDPDQQTQLVVEKKPLEKVSVNAHGLMKWAEAIQPDPDAQHVFMATIKPQDVKVLRAEQVFVVDTSSHAVHSITFEWKPDPAAILHCGYNIYVSDDQMNPLFKGHIPGSVFQTKDTNTYELAIPEGVPIDHKSVLHISVVPDVSTGAIETPFTEVAVLSL
jgi:hypothetical protein